jgi:hypothetical protein
MCIEARSGRGLVRSDPTAFRAYLPPDATESLLGENVLRALKSSRFLTSHECVSFFDPDRASREYDLWVSELMEQFGFTTRYELFDQMRNCGVVLERNLIRVEPTRHSELEMWTRRREDSYADISIPEISDAKIVGLNIKRAFDTFKDISGR